MISMRKICAIKRELARRNIFWESVVPPLWRFFWRCGLAIPPPLFIGFVGNFIMSWVAFWCLFVLIMQFLLASLTSTTVQTFILCGGGAAVFALLDSMHTRRRATSLGVPLWKDCVKKDGRYK